MGGATVGADMGGAGGTLGAAGSAGTANAGAEQSDAGESGSAGAVNLPEPPTVKVMSFNLRYGTAADGDNAWALRRPLTFDVLERQEADLIGIQEGQSAQLLDIDAAVSGYARIGVGRDDGKLKGEFSAIFYRSARFEVEASGTFWFSETPEVVGSKTWGDLPRICTWGHFIDKQTGYGLYHFNVHLDSKYDAAREKSVVLLMKRVSERAVPSDPVIVTGDYNAGEATLASRFMRGAAAIEGAENPLPLLDSYRALYPDATEVKTAHGFKGGTTGEKIDYVYMMPGATALAAEIDRTNDAGRYPSDHYPITGTLRLPNRAASAGQP